MHNLLLILICMALFSCQSASKSLSKNLTGVWNIHTVNELKTTKAKIEFKEDGTLGGNNGCNKFFGQYTVKESTVSISPMGSTKMLCAPNENNVEQHFNSILSNIKSVQIENKSLIIVSKDNKLIKGTKE